MAIRWQAKRGKRPWTLSDFVFQNEDWKPCLSLVREPGDTCRTCVRIIETALEIPDRLSPEIPPYFRAAVEKHREFDERHRGYQATKRKRTAERMDSCPETAPHLYVLHGPPFLSRKVSALSCIHSIVRITYVVLIHTGYDIPNSYFHLHVYPLSLRQQTTTAGF